jgi:3',5'-cyclic AMP phosphodiesterase CpdA
MKINRRTFLLGTASLCLFPLSQSKTFGASEFSPFSFAYITDVYLANKISDTYRLTQESQLFLQDIVKQLNEHPVDFVVFGGDQVENIGKDQANWDLFLDVLQGLNMPWSFVLGEHDVSDLNATNKFKTYGSDWRARGIETNKSYWSHNPVKNVHIIGLDSSVPNSSIGHISDEQIAWLKEDLETHKNDFSIVFCHHPLLPPPPYDAGPPWDEYVVDNGATLREILGETNNVRMVLNGHVHVSKVQQEKNIYHISNPSLTVYPCTYRIFKVTPQTITMETYSVSFPALIKRAKKAIENYPLAYKYDSNDPDEFASVAEGKREDNNALLSLAIGKNMTIQVMDKKKVKKKKKKKEKKTNGEQNRK